MNIDDKVVKDLIIALTAFADALTKAAPRSAGPPPKTRDPHPPSSAPRTIPLCPRCGKAMLLRSRKDGGGQFWGCGGFPECRGIIPIDPFTKAQSKSNTTPPDEDVPF